MKSIDQTIVDSLGDHQRPRFLPENAFLQFDPQVQFQLAIDAIHALVIPGIPFHIKRMQKTQIKPQSR